MSSPVAVLFDAPGPKAKKLYRLVAVITFVIMASLMLLVIRGLADPTNNQLTAAKWSPFLTAEAWRFYFWPGIASTLLAAGISVVLASILGILLGMGRLSELAPLRWFCSAFVEFFRAVPVLMMMLFAYFALLYNQILSGPPLALAGVVIGLTLYNSCVIAELIRSGVGSLPAGQREAGLAVGMSPTQTLFSILLPQAITAMLPSLVSQMVVILKDSALGYWINYLELLNQAKSFGSYRSNTIPSIIVAAVLFIVLNYALTRLAHLIERRMASSRRGIAATVDPVLIPGASAVAPALEGATAAAPTK